MADRASLIAARYDGWLPRLLCRIGLHRWTQRGWTLIDGVVCADCGKEGWDW